MRNIGPIGNQAGIGNQQDQRRESSSLAAAAKLQANVSSAAKPTASDSAAVEPTRIRRLPPSSEPVRERAGSSAPDSTVEPRSKNSKKWKWAFPVGIGLAGLASAAAVLLRGCWHGNMSWPVRAADEHGEFSYQTCNDCGIMRLFDERAFRGYGPYGYELHALIAHERLLRRQRMHEAERREASSRKPAPHKPPEAL